MTFRSSISACFGSKPTGLGDVTDALEGAAIARDSDAYVISVLGLPTIEQRRELPPFTMIDPATVVRKAVERLQAHAHRAGERVSRYCECWQAEPRAGAALRRV